MTYKPIFVQKGSGGWGKGLHLEPNGKKTKVVSVTGGGIHPVAQKISELSGAEAVDGFKNSIPEDEMMCVVIDCGGTARIGVYPMKGIPTVDVMDASPSGPLAKHITEDIFVSGVGAKDVMKGDADADTAKETASAAKLENPTFDTNDKEGYKPVFVQNWSGGWAKGLHLEPRNKETKVVSVTGGGIHPVAQKISELSGSEAVDGFKNSIPADEMMFAVIDCGGTARIGVYP